MLQLTTSQGRTFHSAAYVRVGGRWVEADRLTPRQKVCLATLLNEQALNAACAGRRVYRPVSPLPPDQTEGSPGV